MSNSDMAAELGLGLPRPSPQITVNREKACCAACFLIIGVILLFPGIILLVLRVTEAGAIFFFSIGGAIVLFSMFYYYCCVLEEAEKAQAVPRADMPPATTLRLPEFQHGHAQVVQKTGAQTGGEMRTLVHPTMTVVCEGDQMRGQTYRLETSELQDKDPGRNDI